MIAALAISPALGTHIPDSELILAAYRKWGTMCPTKLLGDFAFAIWDNTNQSLFCARDFFGVRPLQYYFRCGQVFAFSSEIKGLLAIPEVPAEIDEKRVGDFLAWLPADKEITFFKEIRRIPPGHSITLSDRGMRVHRYWAPDPTLDSPLETHRAPEEAYRDVFIEAVRSRLRSASSIGAALSGGLDSSSIVCVARRILVGEARPPLQTFSAVFDGVPESDERDYINAVIRQGNLEPSFVRADKISPLVEWERVLWHQEEPIWTPNLFMHWGLYSAAKERGVRVFLDGFLGDNVVGHGWEYLMDLAYAWKWVPLLEQIRGVARVQPGFSFNSMVWRYFVEFSVKCRLRRASELFALSKHRSLKRRFNPALDPIIDGDFGKRIDLADRVAALQQPAAFPPQATLKRHFTDLTAGEIPLGLEVSNKIGSAFSIEPTYPFTDRRLAEFCLSIPPERRIQDGLSRMIVRRALADYLPPEVCWRTGKGDLSFNVAQRLLELEKERLDEIVFGNSRLIEPFCDLSVLRQRYARYQSEPSGFNVRRIWGPINLALWLDVIGKNFAKT